MQTKHAIDPTCPNRSISDSLNTSEEPLKSGIATFTNTDRHDEFGGTIFLLKWGDTEIECVSGLPYRDPCHPSYDYPGSCRPIPEGVYTVGDPVWERADECDPAIGPDWIPLAPTTEISGRDGFLIHRDWNYTVSPGTAGCPAPMRHQDMGRIVQAVQEHEFDTLVVNYGYGSLPEEVYDAISASV